MKPEELEVLSCGGAAQHWQEIYQSKKQHKNCYLIGQKLDGKWADHLHIHQVVDMIFLIDPL